MLRKRVWFNMSDHLQKYVQVEGTKSHAGKHKQGDMEEAVGELLREGFLVEDTSLVEGIMESIRAKGRPELEPLSDYLDS